MTGLKLHCLPGFVDRAYLVFLVMTQLTELPMHDWDLGRSHPFLVVGEVSRLIAGSSPVAREAPTYRCDVWERFGRRPRRWRCEPPSAPPECFKLHPPGGACPFHQLAAERACNPYPRNALSRRHASVMATSR